MIKTAQDLKEKFIQGVTEAVEEFEKKASYQSWMNHNGFRERFSNNIINLVNKVKVGNTSN